MKFSYISNDDLFYNINSSNIAGEEIVNQNGDVIGFNSTSEIQQLWDLTLGGALPFVFTPDKDADEPELCVCRLDQASLSATQVAYNTWNITMNIYESW